MSGRYDTTDIWNGMLKSGCLKSGCPNSSMPKNYRTTSRPSGLVRPDYLVWLVGIS